MLGPDDGDTLREAVRIFRRMEIDSAPTFLDDPTTFAIVALDDGFVIGWAWGVRQRHVCGYTQVQLYEIEVATPHRRQGHGRALLSMALGLATSEGHHRMWLFTDEANASAKNLYESTGAAPSPHDDATYWWQLDSLAREDDG